MYPSEYADKAILAILVLWLFLVRMTYQEKARWPRYTHPPYPLWERLMVALTSLWLVPAVLYVFTTWIDPLVLALPDWLRKTGAVILSLGVLLYWYGHAALDRNWSAYLEIKPHHTLISRGPYRWVRHPLYLALFIVGAGIALLTANWLLAITYFLPILSLYLVRVRAEEDLLLARFGDEYQAYAARTGRLLPKITPKGRRGE